MAGASAGGDPAHCSAPHTGHKTIKTVESLNPFSSNIHTVLPYLLYGTHVQFYLDAMLTESNECLVI